MEKAVDAAKVYMKEYYENNKSAIKLSQNENKDTKQLSGLLTIVQKQEG